MFRAALPVLQILTLKKSSNISNHNEAKSGFTLAMISSKADITSHIDNLPPPEVLLDILRRVGNQATKSELPGFDALHTTCRHWYDLAKPILWTDVVLNNSTLPLFLSRKHAPNYSIVRSLAIRFRTIHPQIEEAVRNGNNPIRSSNSANSSFQLSTPIVPYVCEGVYYGRGLCVDSCDGALRSMAILSGRPTQHFTWGERAIGHYDSLRSQRWESC